jgi:Flp pilus assembly protein TadG
MSRLVPRRSRRTKRSRGQALVEFALILPILVVFAITIVDIIPGIDTKGLVLDAAATATERTSRFLAPDNGTATTDRNTLCGQILILVRSQLTQSLGPGTVTGAGTNCTPLNAANQLIPNLANANPAVWVAATDAGGTPRTNLRLLPSGSTPITVEVCVSYTWRPKGGLLWFLTKGPAQIDSIIVNSFTYRYCGRDVIDPNRTR